MNFSEEFDMLKTALDRLGRMFIAALRDKDMERAIEYGHKYEAVSMEMDKLLGFA